MNTINCGNCQISITEKYHPYCDICDLDFCSEQCGLFEDVDLAKGSGIYCCRMCRGRTICDECVRAINDPMGLYICREHPDLNHA